MRIRLLVDLPIATECGCVVGKEYEVSFVSGKVYRFFAENGELCGAFSHEFEVVDTEGGAA